MPSVEVIEREKVAYIKEMEEYLRNLKEMSENEAKRISYENLVKSRIIKENGEFTEHYKYTKINMQKKG